MMVLWIEVVKTSRDPVISPLAKEIKALEPLKYIHKMPILISKISRDKHVKTHLCLNVLQQVLDYRHQVVTDVLPILCKYLQLKMKCQYYLLKHKYRQTFSKTDPMMPQKSRDVLLNSMNSSTRREDQQLSKMKKIKTNRKAHDGGTEILNIVSEFLLKTN